MKSSGSENQKTHISAIAESQTQAAWMDLVSGSQYSAETSVLKASRLIVTTKMVQIAFSASKKPSNRKV